ncbi:hypothetical protein Scep_025462 [Stephania cephalantha]|uniref:Uncharacterized protein n=1 Tax=Stephania cephalantha TaxID=152367 RepID=A0AAP0ENV6_9MAGN
MAATLALVALTMMIPGAEASRLIVYSGNNFSGASATIDACGCSNIPYRGSYRYYAEGQSTQLYNDGDCRGPVHTTLATNQNAQMTTGFGWNSAFIVQSAAHLLRLPPPPSVNLRCCWSSTSEAPRSRYCSLTSHPTGHPRRCLVSRRPLHRRLGGSPDPRRPRWSTAAPRLRSIRTVRIHPEVAASSPAKLLHRCTSLHTRFDPSLSSLLTHTRSDAAAAGHHTQSVP